MELITENQKKTQNLGVQPQSCIEPKPFLFMLQWEHESNHYKLSHTSKGKSHVRREDTCQIVMTYGAKNTTSGAVMATKGSKFGQLLILVARKHNSVLKSKQIQNENTNMSIVTSDAKSLIKIYGGRVPLLVMWLVIVLLLLVIWLVIILLLLDLFLQIMLLTLMNNVLHFRW